MATATAAKPSLTLKRRIKAPAEKVFAAWTRPEMIAQWFGPSGASDITAEIDLRVGGRYRLGMRTPDGERHGVSGIYREIVPGEKLAFTWAWQTTPERESLVIVTVKPDGDHSILTLHHEQFVDEPARDRHQQGWGGALEKLANYLER